MNMFNINPTHIFVSLNLKDLTDQNGGYCDIDE